MSLNLNKVLQLFPEKTRKNLYKIRGLFYPHILYRSQKHISNCFSKFSTSNLSYENKEIWKKAFKKYTWQYPEKIEVMESFTTCQIETIQRSNIDFKNGVTLICIVKNDLQRIKMFYKHHREIGIKHFVMLDNNSDDGTFEWLSEQADTDLYQIKEKFSSAKKYGWINRIISMYGFDRWYLYLDSDELFVYQDCERKKISDLVRFVEREQLDRIGSIMIDMYSDKGIYKNGDERQEIEDEYVYFDSDSYYMTEFLNGTAIKGGPRHRVMAEGNSSPLLIKHPLFYFKKGSIFESAHYIYPFISKTSILSALLHYKFLESDLNRHKKIAAEGNFSMGSREYKMYLESYEKNKDISFMYDGTVKYSGSWSLKEVKLIEKIEW